MKPKNFPARKLARQLTAKFGKWGLPVGSSELIYSARTIRSKKLRGTKK